MAKGQGQSNLALPSAIDVSITLNLTFQVASKLPVVTESYRQAFVGKSHLPWALYFPSGLGIHHFQG